MTETVHGDLLPAEQNGEQALAAQAHAAHERIRRHVRQLRGLWVDLAAELHTFNRMKMWRDLGYESFEEYVTQPELELGRRWVYENIAIYEQLVLQWGVQPDRLRDMQISKIREVLPAIRRGQVELEAGLSDATTLSRPDLEIRYRGLASSTPGRPDTSSRVETEHEPRPAIGPSDQGAVEDLRLEYPEPAARLQRCNPEGLPYVYRLQLTVLVRGDGLHADGKGAMATQDRLRRLVAGDPLVQSLEPSPQPDHVK